MRDQALFFRSMAVMFNAGLSLHRSLRLLGNSSEQPTVAIVYNTMSEQLARGLALSEAMKAQPRQFDPYQVALVHVGEKSGSLPRVLTALADQLEKSWTLQRKLSSALVYPGLLTAGCFLLLALAPSYLLSGHLRMLEGAGVPLPWSTRLLLIWSGLLRPSTVLLAGCLLAPLAWKLWRNIKFRQRLDTALRALPGLGHILKLASTARFSRALAISLRSGLNLLEALRLSAAASGDAGLIRAAAQAATSVTNGLTLGEGLQETDYFLSGFAEMVASGEMVGRTDSLLDLAARFCEQELDAALEGLGAVLEPILLLLIGVLTAFMLVAVLQPTLSLLQNL